MKKRLNKKSSFVSLALAAAMLMSLNACGTKDDYEVAEYGTETAGAAEDDNTQIEATVEEVEGETAEESDEKEQNQQSSEGTIADRLGGNKLSFQQDISANGINVKIDINYEAGNVGRIPIYKVRKSGKEDIHEEKIVENIFGDSAIKLDEEGREFSTENGDSREILEYGVSLYSMYTMSDVREHPVWVDAENYFIHTYEGNYRDAAYQLMISYSEEFEHVCYALYPKNPGDVIGNEECDHMVIYHGDGNLVLYDDTAYAMSPVGVNVQEVMGDRPNLTKATDETLEDAVYEMLTGKFDYNMRGVTLHSTREYGEEIILYPGDSIKDPTFSGAVRNGYVVNGGGNLAGLNIYNKILRYVYIASDAATFDLSNAYVDDDGVFGLGFMRCYEFEDEISSDCEILDFNNVMSSLVKAIEDNITTIKEATQLSNLQVTRVNLMYYPQPSPDNGDEYSLIPAWVVRIDSSSSDIGNIVINAMDGSVVSVLE